MASKSAVLATCGEQWLYFPGIMLGNSDCLLGLGTLIGTMSLAPPYLEWLGILAGCEEVQVRKVKGGLKQGEGFSLSARSLWLPSGNRFD